MRRDNKDHPGKKKGIARQKYAERQIDKFVKWSWDNKGRVRYVDILQLHNRYGIDCQAQQRNKWKKIKDGLFR